MPAQGRRHPRRNPACGDGKEVASRREATNLIRRWRVLVRVVVPLHLFIALMSDTPLRCPPSGLVN